MKIPVCVRDGSVPGVIKIGEFEFEIDLTELSTILEYARLEMSDSCLPHRHMLREALMGMEAAAFRVEMNGVRATKEEDTKNLDRFIDPDSQGGWRSGGHHDLQEAWLALKKMGSSIPSDVQFRWDKQEWIRQRMEEV